jgi:hypothetical protein
MSLTSHWASVCDTPSMVCMTGQIFRRAGALFPVPVTNYRRGRQFLCSGDMGEDPRGITDQADDHNRGQ